MKKLLLLLLLTISHTSLVYADFDDGMAAYKKGDYEIAYKEWKPLAEQGDVDAQYRLGQMYLKGEGFPLDIEKAIYWWSKAAEQGVGWVQKRLDKLLEVQKVLAQAEQGDALSQYKLGLRYSDGEGIPQDFEQGAYWVNQAAEQGNADAQYQLWIWLYDGIGIAVDRAKGFCWLAKAAEQGHAEAQSDIRIFAKEDTGNCEEAPKELEPLAEEGGAEAQSTIGIFSNIEVGVAAYQNGDYETALKELEPLAIAGDPEAQNKVGWMNMLGNGVPQNSKKAFFWFHKSAEQGHPKSQFKLGFMYCSDNISPYDGVPEDDEKAIYWLTKAAEQGHASAIVWLRQLFDISSQIEWVIKSAKQGDYYSQKDLGVMYANGNGVPQDYEKAIYWYTKAAEQGDINLQRMLGRVYSDGVHVPIDNEKAIYWYTQAAEQGDADAQNALDEMLKTQQ